MTDRELVRRFARMMLMPPDSEAVKTLKGYLPTTITTEEAKRIVAWCEKGAALEGATEAWVSGSEALGVLAGCDAVVHAAHVGRGERRVFILRPESIAGSE